MRNIFYIFLFVVGACKQNNIVTKKIMLVSQYWVSDSLQHYLLDSTQGGGKTLYGSAYLLYLNSNKTANFLSADFYWKNESLYLGGEPGMTMRTGRWVLTDSQLSINQKIIYKTFKFPDDSLGVFDTDSLKINGDSILLYKGNRLVPLNKISSELKTLMISDWSRFPN